MTWYYKGSEVNSEMVEGYVGFVYLITNLDTDKKYIGKKIFQFSKKKQVKGRKRRYKVESDWKDYFGSCKPLLEDLALLGKEKFHREILYLCETKKDMTYYEVREQFLREVLERPGYYNENILGRFFVRDKTKTIPFEENLCDILSGEYKWERPTKETCGDKEKWVQKAIATRRKNSGGKWSISEEHKQAISEASAHSWEIHFPCGKIEVINNLTQFCREHDLNPPAMVQNKLNGGHLKQHKGFKCRNLTRPTEETY